MGSWGCPHEWEGKCQRVLQRPCDPGMKGCVLAGRCEFSNPEKNRAAGREWESLKPEPAEVQLPPIDQKE